MNSSMLFQGENVKKAKCTENEIIYDLHATVGYIQDPKAGGNLVAHVHVGTTYHHRKEVCPFFLHLSSSYCAIRLSVETLKFHRIVCTDQNYKV